MAGQKSSSDLDTIYHGNAERVPRGSDLRHMSAPSGPPNGIGQPCGARRTFACLPADDLALPRMVHAAFVRSPHAHARIRSMDKTAALAVPGALTVLAGADYVADGLKPFRTMRGSWSRPIWLCAFAACIRSHPRIGRYRSKERVSSAKA
jgi:hypothetical protein